MGHIWVFGGCIHMQNDYTTSTLYYILYHNITLLAWSLHYLNFGLSCMTQWLCKTPQTVNWPRGRWSKGATLHRYSQTEPKTRSVSVWADCLDMLWSYRRHTGRCPRKLTELRNVRLGTIEWFESVHRKDEYVTVDDVPHHHIILALLNNFIRSRKLKV